MATRKQPKRAARSNAKQSAGTKKKAAKSKTPRINMDKADNANLDQVRDILFGAQSREFNDSIARLEERLNKEAAAARNDAKSRIESLESYVKSEFQAVLDRIKSEKEAREEAATNLARQIKELGKDLNSQLTALDKRLTKLDEKLTKSDRGQRENLLSEVTSLRNDLETRYTEQSEALDREAMALRDGKVDRSTLGELLNDVALRLTDQGKPAKKG